VFSKTLVIFTYQIVGETPRVSTAKKPGETTSENSAMSPGISNTMLACGITERDKVVSIEYIIIITKHGS